MKTTTKKTIEKLNKLTNLLDVYKDLDQEIIKRQDELFSMVELKSKIENKLNEIKKTEEVVRL